MTSAGGGPPASRANASGPSSSGRTGASSPSDARPAISQLERLLEVVHRVRVGALDGELAAHHAVEAECRVVVGETHVYRLPAGAQQADREAPRRLGADRLERQVGSEPAGRGPLRLERLLLGAVGRVRAERRGALAPLRLRLEHRHVPDAREQRRLQRHEPDRARAEHDGAVDGPVCEPEAHRVNAVGQRLDERPGARGDARRQLPHARRGGAYEVGEGAVGVDADQLAVAAQVRVAGAAQPAAAAAAERVDGDARALEPIGPRPRRHHHARELVPHHQRRPPVALVPEVALDLGAADPDRGRSHDQLARRRVRRVGPLLERHPLRPGPDDRLHAPGRAGPIVIVWVAV